MGIVLYVSAVLVTYHWAVTAEDARPGAFAFLGVTLGVPVAALGYWVMKRIDWSGNTLY
jgi:hypothetical protein